MESQEEALCTYTGNKIASLPPPQSSSSAGLPPIGNSWIDGAGYLSNLQAQQSKLMPEEYKYGTAPEDAIRGSTRRSRSSRRGSGRQSGRHKHRHHHRDHHTRSSSRDGRSVSALPGSNYANLNSFSPRPEEEFSASQYNPSNDMQFNSLSVPGAADPSLAVACLDKTTGHEEGYDAFRNAGEMNSPNNKPRSPKVVYRNSIENRYLFPTDDSINSTLEADLEDLSQARYGRNAPSRLGSSRNIFKSLCSLVSCMSAHSNNSELEKRYESTIEFSANNSKGANQSMPAVNLDNASKTPAPLIYENAFKNGINDYCLPEYRKLSDETRNVFEKETSTIRYCDQLARQHKSSSSDCGFSSASQNSINFYSHQTCSPVLKNDEERRTIQIYKRIVARLMNSTSLTNEDFYQLRKIIFSSPSCCLHQHQQPTGQPFNADESDQIIADIFKRTAYLGKSSEQIQLNGSTATCLNTSEMATAAYLTDLNQAGNKVILGAINKNRISIENQDNVPTMSSKNNSNRSLPDEVSTSESALSSYDSSCGTAETGCGQRVNSDLKDSGKVATVQNSKSILEGATNLPKAFELKLTLSINSQNNNNGSELQNSHLEQAGGDVTYADRSGPQGDPQQASRELNIST